MEVTYTYNALLVRVIDGDTIEAAIDLGFAMTATMPVRLAHINAPEHNQPGGSEATAYLKTLLGDGKLVFKTYKPKDKYGRYLAEAYVGPLYVNQQMIDSGHAVPYEGGERHTADGYVKYQEYIP